MRLTFSFPGFFTIQDISTLAPDGTSESRLISTIIGRTVLSVTLSGRDVIGGLLLGGGGDDDGVGVDSLPVNIQNS